METTNSVYFASSALLYIVSLARILSK